MEFFKHTSIEWNLHVDSTPGPHHYDMILGCDIMNELGITLNFKDQTMTWDDSTINMKDPESLPDLLDAVNDFFWNNDQYKTEALQEASIRLQKILNAKYILADLDAVVQAWRHLTKDKKHQLHAIVKCAHQMLRNLIRSFELQDNPYLDLDDPWSGILTAALFAMCSTYHTTLRAMPGQLIFGRDMILNMQYLADWTAIKAHKQQLICKNNIIKNSKHIPHQYKVRDKVMLENHQVNKYEQLYKGPYLVMQVNTNGTACLKIGAVTDTVNIRHIHPYKMMLANANHGGDCSMCRSVAQVQHMS